MSVRFVVGRAGSGKTRRCLEALRAGLLADAAAGPRLLFLVPEQASFQMERALIETPGLAGYSRCEVLSFQRLAYRVFAERGADPRRGDQTIGGLGRLMAIRRLIRRQRGRLTLFDRVADKVGLVRQVADAIDELMRQSIEPALLDDLADKQVTANPLAAARLRDLGLLYQAYRDYLLEDRLDPAQYLAIAARQLAHCPALHGAQVWVDGFAGFTAQETEVLASLGGVASAMEIALLVDPDASAVRSDDLPRLTLSLFARTERTLVQLRRRFQEAGIAVEAPVLLRGDEPVQGRHPSLRRLEGWLFSGRSDDAPLPADDAVALRSFPDRRAEVDAAVAEIRRLTSTGDPPLRYREIAVVVRDLDPYHDLLSATMASCGVPCFIDRRQPTAHHPLIELVRALLAVAADDARLDAVRLTLKTGLLPLADTEADLLENYLLAHGLQGWQVWSEPWVFTRYFQHKGESHTLTERQQHTLDAINRHRARWHASLSGWMESAPPNRPQTGQAWASALYGCLEANVVSDRLRAWAEQAEADGRSDEAQLHQQVWTDFVELLDEFVRALGEETMRLGEFRETIEAGLAEFDLGLAPPTLDQVLVGSIDRSRHPAIRAVLLLGFDQSHWPRRRREDPLLGDEERDALEDAGALIGPSRRRQALDERMLAYIALTRSSDRLWISYPRAEADGTALQASPFLQEVLRAVPGLAVQHADLGDTGRQPQRCLTVADLGGRLAAELRYRPVLGEEADLPRRGLWNAVYVAARQRTDWRATLRRSLAGLAYRNDAVLRAGQIERALSEPFVASVSRLELFAACPFAHFAEYLLKLDPRAEAELAAVDVGTFCHAILEKFVADLVAEQRGFSELSEDEVAERMDAAVAFVRPLLTDEMLLDQARHASLADRHSGYMRRVGRWQRFAAGLGRFKPYAVEFPFGYSGQKAAPLTLTTPKGRKILLRGKIDRVDFAEEAGQMLATVIDYKTTTDRRLDMTNVYHGLSLQLVGYLLALQQNGQSLTGRPIRPAAAFYLPLLEPYHSVASPEEERGPGFRWRGVVDARYLKALDDTMEAGESSQIMNAALTNQGEPYQRGDLIKGEQMDRLLVHVGRKMGELADALIDGRIEVSPYRLRRQMPCGFCPYRVVCRYEVDTQSPRTLDSFGSSGDAIAAMDVGDTQPNTNTAGGRQGGGDAD